MSEPWRELLRDPAHAVGPLPATLPDLEARRARWAQLHYAMLARYEANLKTLAAERASARLPSTPGRLDALRAGLEANRQELGGLLADLDIRPARPPGKRAPQGSLIDHYQQILRDWAWGERTEENARARAQVAASLDDELGVGVVLGCGAGRLACDLARLEGTTRLLCVDVDPLPLAVLHRMLEGTPTRLHELPRQPRTRDDAAHPWDLTPLGPLDADVVPLFADGRDPGLREGALDSVILPWYLDQVDAPPADTLDVAHYLLRPGGQLVFHGPLIHRADRGLAEHLTLPELLELLAARGFDVGYERTERVPYLCSPLSAVGRLYDVYTVRARRDDGPARPLVRGEWLHDDRAAVPRPPGLERVRAPNPVVAEVILLLDGRRSVREIAKRVRKKFGLRGDTIADTRQTVQELYRRGR
jgi:SAM-dependent methyltransferase